MRAALLLANAALPVVARVDEPRPSGGEVVARVLAAALNPVDLLIAAGRHASIHPTRPYVPGFEGVGVVDGPGGAQRVWWIAGIGAWAEQAVLNIENAIEVPPDLSNEEAAGIGIAGMAAWMALTDRAQLRKGERVLIVGGSGAVGRCAIQIARHLGAGRIVAAARSGSADLLDLGADAVVPIKGRTLLRDLQRAEPNGFDVVLDLLFGKPGEAAVEAAADEGRVVLLSQLAGTKITLSASVLQKRLSIVGFRNSTTPIGARRDAYRRVAELVAGGQVHVQREVYRLQDVGEAWARQAASPHCKLILTI